MNLLTPAALEPPKIFISYSRADGQQFAIDLANELRKIAADVWIDVVNIPPGKKWDNEIEQALKNAGIVLFIATEKSTTSDNVLNEVYYAIEENKVVIPALFHDCHLPFLLRRFQYIDFRPTADYTASFKRLQNAIGSAGNVAAVTDTTNNNTVTDEQRRLEREAQITAQNDENAWKNAISRNTITAYENYLDVFPYGKYSQEAKNKINALEKPKEKGNTKLIIGIAATVIVLLIIFFNRNTGPSNDHRDYPDTSGRVKIIFKDPENKPQKTVTDNNTILPSPALISPQNNSTFDFYPRTTNLKWNAVNGASTYTVEVDCMGCCAADKWCADLGKQFKIISKLLDAQYTFDFVGAQPGRWRVWAVDANGKEGTKSDWNVFTYTK